MRRLFQNLRERVEDGLRGMCGRMTPDKRLITIAVLIVVFAGVNIWLTFRAIYSIGHEDQQIKQLQITPLTIPDFDLDEREPAEPEGGIENYFKQHFKTEENDTTEIEQGQTEP